MFNINNNLINRKSKTNKIKLKNFLPILLSILVLTIIIILISNPTKYNESVKTGFMLFANCVFPGLFPFLILTKILTDLGFVKKLSKAFSKLTNKLFHVSGISSYIFIMSALCGYPMGAKLTADLIKSNVINKEESQKILSFCSVSGPVFTLGTVGVSMFGSFKIGIIIFISHLVASLLNGLIYCNTYKLKSVLKRKKLFSTKLKPLLNNNVINSNQTLSTLNNCIITKKTLNTTKLNEIKQNEDLKPMCNPTKCEANKVDYDKLLGNSVYNAISTILMVGAYITVFFMLIDMVLATHILLPLEQFLNLVLIKLGAPANLSNGILCGIIEMTRGCSELAKLGNSTWQVVCASGLLSFSGISIIVQSLTLLSGTGIKAYKYIFQKIMHAVLTMLVCFLICKIFII